MFKIDGSEVCWLIYADWLDEQGLRGEWVRSWFVDYGYEFNDKDIFEPTNHWNVGERSGRVVGGLIENNVGSEASSDCVGSNDLCQVPNGCGTVWKMSSSYPGCCQRIGIFD